MHIRGMDLKSVGLNDNPIKRITQYILTWIEDERLCISKEDPNGLNAHVIIRPQIQIFFSFIGIVLSMAALKYWKQF